MSQRKWQMIAHTPPFPGAPQPRNPGRTEILHRRLPQTSGFGASKPASFLFGGLLFILSEEFPERSTNSILTDVTQAGNSAGSQVSPGYMLSGLPKVALDHLPREVSACSYQRGLGSQWRQLLLVVDSRACLITQSQRWWLLLAWLPVGSGGTFFCQHRSQHPHYFSESLADR